MERPAEPGDWRKDDHDIGLLLGGVGISGVNSSGNKGGGDSASSPRVNLLIGCKNVGDHLRGLLY